MGTARYQDRSCYEGEWKDDRWNGKGTHTTAVFVYVGDFVRGKKEGFGKCEYESGAYYEGPWKEGKEHGSFGIYVDNNSWETKYEGEWENGQRIGKGVVTYHSGAKWEGNFLNNKPSGNGKLNYENGVILTGKWKSGMLEYGKCELVSKGGTILSIDKDDPTRIVAPPLDVPFVNISHLHN